MGKGSKKKDKKAKGWSPVDPATVATVEWDGFESQRDYEVPPVTWPQRVYLAWLVLSNLQQVIAQSNKFTISPHIDAARRHGNSLGLPYREVDAPTRIKEALVVLRNVVTKGEGE